MGERIQEQHPNKTIKFVNDKYTTHNLLQNI